MDENINPMKKRLSEQLPTHSPDPGSWQRMSAKLDALGAENAFREKIEQLPQHSPDIDTWSKINLRLNRIGYYKTAKRIALAVAAGLALFITVSRVTDYVQKPDANTQFAQQLQNNKLADPDDKSLTPAPVNTEKQIPEAENNLVSKNKSDIPKPETKIKVEAKNELVAELANESESQVLQIPVSNENISDVLAEIHSSSTIPISQSETDNIDTPSESKVFQPELSVNPLSNPSVKYYTPKEPVAGENNNLFAVAMNYLPENVNNGTDNSIFHNVDLTASYNKEKVRFNTSVGMAYNEEQLEFDMNYDVKTPVTAIGPSGHLDTLRYDVANVDSQYQGTEKHQYVTYNLGLGRRLFSFGKFSSWINAGAGFGIQVNNPDLIASTQNSIKGQYNAQIISVKSDKPVYNDVNVNFVTGIDFNYSILNKLSITFAPTSRWYFKPLLTKDNQPTDELTLGFRTGLKLDF